MTPAKRYCKSCGDPLNSTKTRCHDCGGDSYRGNRGAGTYDGSDGITLEYLLRVFGL